MTGPHLRQTVTIRHGLAVIRELVHHTTKVLSLVDPHPEGSSVLLNGFEIKTSERHSKNPVLEKKEFYIEP